MKIDENKVDLELSHRQKLVLALIIQILTILGRTKERRRQPDKLSWMSEDPAGLLAMGT